jgi:hypothetical protein
VIQVDIDLAAGLGGNVPDGIAENVFVTGTVDTRAGADDTLTSGVAGVLQVLVDGAPV